MNSGRLKKLDILKGIACISVYMHHFLLAYFPASYYGTERHSTLCGGLDYVLSSEPLGVLVNGDFWVAVFILIAAFLQARKSMLKGSLPVRDSVKRYLRLMLPVIPAGIINYLVKYIMQITEYTYRGPDVPYGFGKLLLHMFAVQWVQSDGTVLGPLWMIYALFLGSIGAMLLGIFDKKNRVWPMLLSIILLGAAYKFDVLFIPAVLGFILADLLTFDRLGILKCEKYKGVIKTLAILMIIAGLYFGGYPSYAQPGAGYSFLPHTGYLSANYRAVHAAAAFMTVAGVCIYPKDISGKPKLLTFISDHSYSIYLLHIIWIDAVGYGLFWTMVNHETGYTAAGLITFAVLTVLMLASSVMYNKYERKCEEYSKHLTSWIKY